jgi:hypothetical protein
MTPNDFSEIVETINLQRISSVVQRNSTFYQLVNVPIVYHVLPNQDGGGILQPSLTKKQEIYTTNVTNQLFNIYNKKTKQYVPFISFVTNDTIVHRSIRSGRDCGTLSVNRLTRIVKRANDWQFKMHVIVCEISSYSGRASFPHWYEVTNPLHNMGTYMLLQKTMAFSVLNDVFIVFC